MNRRWKILVIMIIMTGSILQATADTQNPMDKQSIDTDLTKGITEQKAITIAQQQVNGRVLAINQTNQTYRVKILSSQGRIHIVLIDVQDGSVISTH